MLKKMSADYQKHLIILLIKDDLIHTKLMNGLEAIGLITIDYHIALSATLFDLLGFSSSEYSDEVFQFYLAEREKVNRIDIRKKRNSIDKLAVVIYEDLERRRANGK